MTEKLSLAERLRMESYRKIGEDVVLGEVSFNADACKGCGLCVAACAASAIELTSDKKARMVTFMPYCMSCGDCTAICPEGAITLTEFIVFKRFYKYLDRGEPSPPRKF